jgi:hypothetical protein
MYIRVYLFIFLMTFIILKLNYVEIYVRVIYGDFHLFISYEYIKKVMYFNWQNIWYFQGTLKHLLCSVYLFCLLLVHFYLI